MVLISSQSFKGSGHFVPQCYTSHKSKQTHLHKRYNLTCCVLTYANEGFIVDLKNYINFECIWYFFWKSWNISDFIFCIINNSLCRFLQISLLLTTEATLNDWMNQTTAQPDPHCCCIDSAEMAVFTQRDVFLSRKWRNVLLWIMSTLLWSPAF